MEFIVRPLTGRPDTILVRYDCPCGCKPSVEHQRNSTAAGFEHCCCGNVHFVGQSARANLEAYLEERRVQHNPDDLQRGGYDLHDTTVTAPWGNAVPVAYGLPRNHTEHQG